MARALRELRTSEWGDIRLTQQDLAGAFSGEIRVAPATLSSWESLSNPKMPPAARLEMYARFFSTRASLIPQPHLIPRAELDAEAARRYEELKSRLEALLDPSNSLNAEVGERSTWQFLDRAPVTVICPEAPANAQGPLSSAADPNYTKLHRFADLDALVELHGHLRAQNPETEVRFLLASEAKADDLSGHVVVVGGIAWNPVTKRLLTALRQMPVSQIEDPKVDTGEIFAVGGPEGRRFYPEWEEDGGDGKELIEDVALLVRVPNPFNSSVTLTFCNGVHSRGVLGAVRALTDARIRDLNEAFLARRFPDGVFALLMRVPVMQGEAISPDLANPETRLFEWPADERVER
jgi:hypothetical protein